LIPGLRSALNRRSKGCCLSDRFLRSTPIISAILSDEAGPPFFVTYSRPMGCYICSVHQVSPQTSSPRPKLTLSLLSDPRSLDQVLRQRHSTTEDQRSRPAQKEHNVGFLCFLSPSSFCRHAAPLLGLCGMPSDTLHIKRCSKIWRRYQEPLRPRASWTMQSA
jgi:hypothetical protein